MLSVNDKLKVKVVGNPADVAKFVNELESLYSNVVSSGAVPNSQDNGIHVFINLNPKTKA